MIQCPVCSSEVDSEAQLVRCEGCIWRNRRAASVAQDRLNTLRKGAGEYAYATDGCSVCPACRTFFETKAALCPLVLFYNVPLPDPQAEPETEPERFVDEAEECWDAYLRERGYPEHVEAYWRRLTHSVHEPAAG